MQDQKVAVVTGSSSVETSFALARNGFHTYATMRNLQEKSSLITEKARNENLPLQTIQLDVNTELISIEIDESFRIEYNPARGTEIEFYKKSISQ